MTDLTPIALNELPKVLQEGIIEKFLYQDFIAFNKTSKLVKNLFDGLPSFLKFPMTVFKARFENETLSMYTDRSGTIDIPGNCPVRLIAQNLHIVESLTDEAVRRIVGLQIKAKHLELLDTCECSPESFSQLLQATDCTSITITCGPGGFQYDVNTLQTITINNGWHLRAADIFRIRTKGIIFLNDTHLSAEEIVDYVHGCAQGLNDIHSTFIISSSSLVQTLPIALETLECKFILKPQNRGPGKQIWTVFGRNGFPCLTIKILVRMNSPRIEISPFQHPKHLFPKILKC